MLKTHVVMEMADDTTRRCTVELRPGTEDAAQSFTSCLDCASEIHEMKELMEIMCSPEVLTH